MLKRGLFWTFFAILIAITIASYSCFPNSISKTASTNAPSENSSNQQQPTIINDNTSSQQSVQKASGTKSQILFGRWGLSTPATTPALSLMDLDKCELCVMDGDGSNQISLTPSNLMTSGADWFPDKSKIVIQSNRDRDWKWESDLFIINPDGSNWRKITNAGGRATTNSSGPVYKSPSWSPDGTMIAYSKTYPSGSEAYKYNVYLMNYDGTEKQITFNPQAGTTETAVEPQWFPDGKRLAYIYSESGFYYIQSIDIVSRNLIKYGMRITFPSQLGDLPSYALSPDGRMIAFSNDTYRDYNNLGRELFIYDIATGLTTRLTNNDYDDDHPCWSPDGKQILFARYNWKDWVANSSGIFSLNCDECGLYKISVDGTIEKMPGTDGTFMPIEWR